MGGCNAKTAKGEGCDVRDKVSIVVAVLGADVVASVLKKIVHRSVSIINDLYLISFNPDLNTNQDDVHVERTI